MEIFYWQDNKKREVDFVIKEEGRVQELIQTRANNVHFMVKERETTALIKASNELKGNNLLIITLDYENGEKIDGKNNLQTIMEMAN